MQMRRWFALISHQAIRRITTQRTLLRTRSHAEARVRMPRAQLYEGISDEVF
jgi:hypothetical protein